MLPRCALKTARRPSGEIASTCLAGREETSELVRLSAGRTLICSRETNGAAGGLRLKSQPAATPSTRTANSQGRVRMIPAARLDARAGVDDEMPIDAVSPNTNCATAMSPMRALRSFSRHLWINATTGAGVSAGRALQSGVDLTTAAMVSVMSSPGNARTPVSIS